MRSIADRMLTQIREFFSNMSRKNKITFAILTVLVIVLAVVAVIFLGRTNYITLHTAQTSAEAGRIYEALIERGVPARVEGLRVLVPEGRVGELSAVLSAQGVIGLDETDLSILYSAAGFNITDSQAKKIYEAQRASEIRGQLLETDKILNARVTLNMGEYSPFVITQGVRDATASVMLVLRGGLMLTNTEAYAIAELIRNSIPGIRYENITITDNNLNYYYVGETLLVTEDTVDPDVIMNQRVSLQNRLIQQLQAQGEQMLTPVVGMSNVQVMVQVRLNWDERTIESVEYAPPVPGELDGIIRSAEEIRESQRRNAGAEGIPGTDPNGMGTVEYPYGTLDDGEQYGRWINARNYEINETRTTIIEAQGKIEYIGVAVVVNSDAMDDDYTEAIANLVSRGMGIPLANVAVESMPFSSREASFEDLYSRWEEYEEQMKQQEFLQMIIKYSVILLLGIAFISLIRTIVKAMRPLPEPVPVPALAEGAADYHEEGLIDYIVDDEEYYEDEEAEEQARIEELVVHKKSMGLEQIERFIDRDPGAVAQLLRNWLTDEE